MTTLLAVPGFTTVVAVTNSAFDLEQTERDIELWLSQSDVGQEIFWDVEFHEGGYIDVQRNEETFNIEYVEIFGDNGMVTLEALNVEDFSTGRKRFN